MITTVATRTRHATIVTDRGLKIRLFIFRSLKKPPGGGARSLSGRF
jgi:hypothetical protein